MIGATIWAFQHYRQCRREGGTRREAWEVFKEEWSEWMFCP
jgi:hypothetical protein